MSLPQYGTRAYNAEGYVVEVCKPEYYSPGEAKWCAVECADDFGAKAGWGLDEIPVRVEVFVDVGDDLPRTVAVGTWDPDAEVRIWTEPGAL